MNTKNKRIQNWLPRECALENVALNYTPDELKAMTEDDIENALDELEDEFIRSYTLDEAAEIIHCIEVVGDFIRAEYRSAIYELKIDAEE